MPDLRYTKIIKTVIVSKKRVDGPPIWEMSVMNLATCSVPFASLSRPFAYRPQTSDESVIGQIFTNSDYHIGRLQRVQDLVECHNYIVAQGKAPLVVDAGANIGASAVFFCGMFPSCRVVAIEPEGENYELLATNTHGLSVECMHAAVSSAPGQVTVVNPNIGNWGYRTEAAPTGETHAVESVPCVTISDIYAARQECLPFIVKIDIEGGEADLFATNTEWVAATPLLIIELHDWMLTGSANSRNFLKCVSQLDRDFIHIGENVFSISNTLPV